jgi:hypothetical protein
MSSNEAVGVRGSYRLHIVEGDKIVGDSGWLDNVVTNEGFRSFLARLLGGISGSSQITHMVLGTGGAPAVTDNTLAGEVVKRQAVTAATSSTSKAVLFTATFSSANSFVTDTRNISNIALAATSTQGAATIFAGNTFASSSCATNQDVQCSYSITFA